MSENGGGWFQRLKAGLARSSQRLSDGITAIVAKRRLDDATLDELEELLIGADLGAGLAEEFVSAAAPHALQSGGDGRGNPRRARRGDGEVAGAGRPAAEARSAPRSPSSMLVVGVNGSGKTTTIGKLAKHFRDEGKSVVIAAGDTFRAAAVEQLKIWGERAGAGDVARGRRRRGGPRLRRLRGGAEARAPTCC